MFKNSYKKIFFKNLLKIFQKMPKIYVKSNQKSPKMSNKFFFKF